MPINWSHRTVFQLTLLGMSQGSQIVNVFTYEATQAAEATYTSDALAQAASGELVDEWLAGLQTQWLAFHHLEYVLQMAKCQVIERPGNFRHKLVPVERPLTTGNTGTAAGQAEHASPCIVVKWRTPQAGKHSRGRSYLGPMSGADASDGVLITSARPPVQAWVTAHHNLFAVDASPPLEYVHTVYSRPYNQGEYAYPRGQHPNKTFYYPPDYGGNSTNVTANSIDWTMRNQRRRNLGVGG